MSATRVGAAVAAGYVLGRFKKLRLALIVGSALGNDRIRSGGLGMLTKGTRGLNRTPEVSKISDQVKGQLWEAGKAAAVSAAAGRIDRLSDRLHERSSGLAGQDEEPPQDAEDEYDEDYDESEEAEAREDEAPEDQASEDEDQGEEPEDEYEDVDEGEEPEDEYEDVDEGEEPEDEYEDVDESEEPEEESEDEPEDEYEDVDESEEPEGEEPEDAEEPEPEREHRGSAKSHRSPRRRRAAAPVGGA